MKSSRRIVPAVILFLCCLAHALYAAPPKTISYQGYLKDGTGKPVTAATNLTFRLYSSTRAESGAFWVEPRSVTPANGVYSVELGTSAPMDPLTFDRQYFLGVTVESGSEMTPRQPLTSAPYAIRARIANSVALGSIGTAAISDNSVTTVKIATGAVTDAQISGTISAGKLDLSGVQEKYGKVAVVAQSGGDYTDVISPMIQLATWCGTPSSTNRCLIKIMPGVYDITADVLFMHQYVDIEGSGENTTVITGTISNDSSPPAYGVVNGADNAEIRFLTIKNTATSGSHQAALVNSGTSPKMTFLTTNATGTGGGSHYGVSNISSSPTMSNITATGAGATNYNYGVRNYSSSPIMSNIMATGAGGNSSYGVYNSVSSSPTMSNVTASASGGSESLGVYNSSSSSPTMSHVTASGAGATASNYGVQNYSSSPTMIDVTATGSGGNWAYGVYNNNSSSPTMSNVTATASGGGQLTIME